MRIASVGLKLLCGGLLCAGLAHAAAISVNGECKLGNCAAPDILAAGARSSAPFHFAITLENGDRFDVRGNVSASNDPDLKMSLQRYAVVTFLGGREQTESAAGAVAIDFLQNFRGPDAATNEKTGSESIDGTFSGTFGPGTSVVGQIFSNGGVPMALMGPFLPPSSFAVSKSAQPLAMGATSQLDQRVTLVIGPGTKPGAFVQIGRPPQENLPPGTIYRTGFDQPYFHAGPLAGQDGWSSGEGSPVGAVVPGKGQGGTQAVEFQAEGLTGAHMLSRDVSYRAQGGAGPQIVVLRVAVAVSESTRASTWDVLGAAGTGGAIGNILIKDGAAQMGGSAPVPLPKGGFPVFELDLNYTNQTATGFMNQRLIGSMAFEHSAMDLKSVRMGIYGDPGNDSARFDNLNINRMMPTPLNETGFEAPDFHTGALTGQKDWSGSRAAKIKPGIAHGGKQAVEYDSDGASEPYAIGAPLSYQYVKGPGTHMVVVQIAEISGTSGKPSSWQILNAISSSGPIAQIFIADGGAKLGVKGGGIGNVAIAKGAWNTYELDLNFDTQVATAFVNKSLIGSGAFVARAIDVIRVAFGIKAGPGSDLGYFDDLSVAATR